MAEVSLFLLGFILGYGIASFLLAKKKFIIKTSEEGEITIEPLNRTKQKMQFLPEMDQKEIEAAEKSSAMKSFLGGFKKSAKQEEEEEVEEI
jgi:hypothetical protein